MQDKSFYFPITAPANANVIIISVLLIIAGGLMVGISIYIVVLLNEVIWEVDDHA